MGCEGVKGGGGRKSGREGRKVCEAGIDSLEESVDNGTVVDVFGALPMSTEKYLE